ncbi:MAG TPA: hypothetical protein VL017_04915 [Devosia sp.]|nr:hypothetical protein [Devosia sp.]
MMRRLTLAIAALSLLSQGAAAGWYQVDNYEGTLGPNAIHLSLQTYDFGSGITVEGSYFLEGQKVPAVVYGHSLDGKIRLCEIADDAEFDSKLIQGSATPFDTSDCPIALEIGDDGLVGTWVADGASHAITLAKVASLDDTGDGTVVGTVIIPFWDHTSSHMFSGIYAQGDTGICMESLRLINKQTSQVDQEISFDDNDLCAAGTVMTQIYRNVETYDDSTGRAVLVSFADGRWGYEVDYRVDPVTGLLSPAP